MRLADSENNTKKKGLLAKIVDRTLSRILRRGFYGEARFTVSVHNGSIQDIDEQVNQNHRME